MNYKKIMAMGLIVSTITMTSHMKLYASYDANAAVDYANRYAETPNNWDYHYFSGVDCTNFVSQCAIAGGATMRNKAPNCYLKRIVIKDDEAWYHLYDGYHYLATQSWTVVDEFYQYWKKHSGATYSANCTIEQLKLIVKKGDIIQCARGSKFSHSVICTGNSNSKNSYDLSKITLAYHSNNKKNITLSEFNNNFDKTNAVTYRIIRFK
ncbi:MAG: hypothetical protein HFI34_04340 [Lachnospiraceae bacterium]|nr:hypothetical protein [Lachnospiraceae bacterium]